jgi:hypothetical protein
MKVQPFSGHLPKRPSRGHAVQAILKPVGDDALHPAKNDADNIHDSQPKSSMVIVWWCLSIKARNLQFKTGTGRNEIIPYIVLKGWSGERNNSQYVIQVR